MDFPPALAHKPHRDLTGQVTKSPGVYIAYGGFSDIYKGIWTNPGTGQSTVVAIKLLRVIYADRQDWVKMSERLNRETWVWDQLSHPNVLPFLGISNDAGVEGSPPALITPLCANGHVLNYLTQNPNADRLKVVVGVAEGLRYLHSQGVIHGDLKPTNILIGDGGEPLLHDFGRSRIIGQRGFTSRVFGNIRYQAPELIGAMEDIDMDAEINGGGLADEPFVEEIYSDKLTTKTDVYAYAVVTLEIFTGKSPYYYITNEFLKAKYITRGEQLRREKYDSPLLTDTRWGLLAECWVKDPTKRPEVDLILPRLI